MEARRALVLIVDDDVRSARRLAQLLREDGYDVEIAYDGASAIARLARDPVPAALVTDLRLPNADGLAVSKFARTCRSDIPICVVTSYPNLASALDALDPKPMVFTKPLVYGDFSAALSRMMS